MSIDIKSMLIGRTQGKKGGKAAVLAELTVTENGVYDEPTSLAPANPDTIDTIEVGSTILLKEKITLSQETLDKLKPYGYKVNTNNGVYLHLYQLYEDDGSYFHATIYIYDTGTYVIEIHNHSDTYAYVSGGLGTSDTHYGYFMTPHKWYKLDTLYKDAYSSEPPSFIFRGDQTLETYNSVDVLKIVANECFLTYVPVDGWDKVTVDIEGAGLIIDKNSISEVFAMGYIKNGAIYRVIEEVDGATLYLYTGSEIIDVFSQLTAEGWVPFNISIVDEIPQLDVGYSWVNVYIVRGTGEAYYVVDEVVNLLDADIKPYYADAYGTDFEFRGVVGSTDEIAEPGFYTVFGLKEKVSMYFIADNVPVCRANWETGAWDQLMSYDEWQNQ